MPERSDNLRARSAFSSRIKHWSVSKNKIIVVLILHIFQLALEIEVFVSYKHDGILWASDLENHD